MEHRASDMIMGLVVLFNLYLIVLDTDAEADCERDDSSQCRAQEVKILNWGLLALYTLELLARVIIFQSVFPRSRWNILDAVVLGICYVEALFWILDLDVDMAQGGLQVARIVRLGRLIRLVKVFKIFPSLYAMIRGFIGTIFTIWWGFVFILLILVIWGIIAVQFIHPDNK